MNWDAWDGDGGKDGSKLSRFRVDPKKVRVSIRRSGQHGWTVKIRTRDRNARVLGMAKARGHDLERVIDIALLRAERLGIDGIDRSMEWAYFNPWK